MFFNLQINVFNIYDMYVSNVNVSLISSDFLFFIPGQREGSPPQSSPRNSTGVVDWLMKSSTRPGLGVGVSWSQEQKI